MFDVRKYNKIFGKLDKRINKGFILYISFKDKIKIIQAKV